MPNRIRPPLAAAALGTAALSATLPGCVLSPTIRGAPPELGPPPAADVRGEKLLDLRGVVHCHSSLSHDSEGQIGDIARAASRAGLRFVAMTDHYTPRAIREGFRGEREGVVFFVGAEVSRDRGSILAIGLGEPLPGPRSIAPPALVGAAATENVAAEGGATRPVGAAAAGGNPAAAPATAPRTGASAVAGSAAPAPGAPPLDRAAEKRIHDALGTSQEVIDQVRVARGLTFIGHAERFRNWKVTGWDGLEIYNLHADAADEPWPSLLVSGLFLPPGAFFGTLVDRPDLVLAKWDELCKRRRVPGVGGCDAHENVKLFGPLGGRIGSYGECFRTVTTHVLVREPTPEAILEALREGRAYVAFEIDGDATGFAFDLVDRERRVVARMGEESHTGPGRRLVARAPGGARIVLLCNGETVAEVAGGGLLEVEPRVPGVYRVEAYRDGRPFVFSNPIYLRR